MKSEFKIVFAETTSSDSFYRFLQVIFHLFPEDKFHHLLRTKSQELATDEAIYQSVQAGLPAIRPFMQPLTYALLALRKQKREMARQVQQILGDRREIKGYLEIGSTGRYISELKNRVKVQDGIFLTNDIHPDYSLAEIFERGQLSKLGQFFDLNDYRPIDAAIVPDQSVDVVTCHIGLHHCPTDRLQEYLASIHRILRPGGLFVLRDHDVTTPAMDTFVSLVHTVFNLGLNAPWETNQKEYRSFNSVAHWVREVEAAGFSDMGFRLLQDLDPSMNTLMGFVRK
ncbi:MAG: methyltransferase domain-containing protein [Cyclobacteriaceae bacterium]|nr:methyltransferase domain-containing protein [Cyclobacteriaceae bacterium]